MKCETNLLATPCIVRIGGDVDLSCMPALAELEKKLVAPSAVVMDVADLEYADTSFLRFLLRLKKHENKAQRDAIRLVRVNRRLRRLLEITGLSRVFACSFA
jgi:anti-anti-sigma factor